MLHHMNFAAVVEAAEHGTKAQQANLYHTWYGWTSKGVLHITSKSGAATRPIWHFDVRANAGARMFFKNTTSQAFCYVQPGAQDVLEEVLFKHNPSARIERVESIDIEMLTRGSGCSHDTQRGRWYSIFSDGTVTVTGASPVVTSHMNKFHVGCPTRSDTNSVKGGTYAVQWQSGNGGLDEGGPVRVVVTPQADPQRVAAVLRAEQDVREVFRAACYSNDLRDETLVPLMAELVLLDLRDGILTESQARRLKDAVDRLGHSLPRGLYEAARDRKAPTDEEVSVYRAEVNAYVAAVQGSREDALRWFTASGELFWSADANQLFMRRRWLCGPPYKAGEIVPFELNETGYPVGLCPLVGLLVAKHHLTSDELAGAAISIGEPLAFESERQGWSHVYDLRCPGYHIEWDRGYNGLVKVVEEARPCVFRFEERWGRGRHEECLTVWALPVAN